MNGAGNNKKTGYLVIALLLVGLTAYSNAVKELTEIHRLTMGTTQLITLLANKTISGQTVPAEIPQIPQTEIKHETCESKRFTAVAEIPWAPSVPDVHSKRH